MDGSSEAVPAQAMGQESSLMVAPVAIVKEVASHHEEMNNLKDMLGRPRLLTGKSNGTWNMVDNIVITAAELIGQAQLAFPREQYEFSAFTVCLRATLTSSATDQGACFMVWDPRSASGRGGQPDLVATTATWCHHVPVDLRESNIATLKAPWSTDYRVIAANNASLEGEFALVPVIPVKGSSSDRTVSVRFQYWLEDVTLSLPRAQSKMTFGSDGEKGHRVWPEEQIGVEALVTTPTLAGTVTFNKTQAIGAEISLLNAFSGTSRLAKLITGADLWRCDVVFQLLAVKTPFHRGIVSLTGRGNTAAFAGTDLARKGVEWDLGKSSTACVRIPFVHNRLMSSQSSIWSSLAINVLSPLEAPDNVASEMNFLVYVHGENFRLVGPKAEGWMLRCEEGIEDLIPAQNTLPVVGKTLSEWVSEEFRLGTSQADSAASAVGIKPFQFDQETDQKTFVTFLSRFFAFYEGVATCKVKFGLGLVENSSEAGATFNWHAPFHGGVQINCVYTGSGLQTTDLAPVFDANTAGFHRMVSSGDTLEVDVHSDPTRLNPGFNIGSINPLLLVDTESMTWDASAVNGSTFPRISVSRIFKGTFYGMIPF